MTNKQKATHVLAIIADVLNLPKEFTIGDVALYLGMIDPDDEIMKILKTLIRDAVIDEIKEKVA